MKTRILLFLIFVSVADSFCQNRNSIWCFGDSAGIDFSTGTPITFASGLDGRGSCASIADSNGSLLFYADNIVLISEVRIFNSNHDTMPNTGYMYCDGLYNEMIIIPKPASDSLYYLFYTGLRGLLDSTYYAVIDMKLNGGLGGIISKNNFLDDYRPADCLTAIKHGNGRDWWIIGKLSNINGTTHNRFYRYLVTPDSIYNPIVQNFNDATDGDFQKIVFNSDGTKFMLINNVGFMCEYNFNRCTGFISNPNIIFQEQTGNYTRLFWEGAYSPNNRFFYVTKHRWPSSPQHYLLKYDLNASNIPLSCDTLETWQPPIGTGAVRLAPDGKIYLSRAYEYGFPGYPYPDSVRNYVNENLSVINYPDSAGTACNYQPFSFYLGGKRTYYGLPNNPNYELSAVTGSICDTLTGVTNNAQEIKSEVFVYYNSSWQKVFINVKGLKGKNFIMRVYDLLGNVIYTEEEKLSSQYFTRDLNMAAFAKGMYIVNLVTERERMVKKFVKD